MQKPMETLNKITDDVSRIRDSIIEILVEFFKSPRFQHSYGGGSTDKKGKTIKTEKNSGILARLGGTKDAVKNTFIEITLQIDANKQTAYLPDLGKNPQPLHLSVSATNQEEEGITSNFNLEILPDNLIQITRISTSKDSKDIIVGRCDKIGRFLRVRVNLPLAKAVSQVSADITEPLKLDVKFGPSSQPITLFFR